MFGSTGPPRIDGLGWDVLEEALAEFPGGSAVDPRTFDGDKVLDGNFSIAVG